MTLAAQANSFGEVRLEGQGSSLVINQTVQITPNEVKSRQFWAASPYCGLEAFNEAISHLFFGRDATILELFQAVPEHPLLTVSGASGSGKSSVVRAGLIPQLAQRVQGFRAFKMKPGSDPFGSLKSALLQENLRELTENRVKFAATAHETTLPRVAALRPPAECWLLLIDQFEELFTQCETAEKRGAFFAGLLAVATAREPRFRVVLTMRSDFFDRFDLHPALLRAIWPGLRMVTSPTPEELRQCIEQPAAQHGVIFEDGLVERILSEIKGQPGALPLLQYMLDLLWRQDNPADDKTLNASSYVLVGGVRGALCQRAEAVYATREHEARSEVDRQRIRQVFLRLIDISKHVDSAPVVSKRTPLSAFSEAEQEIVRELVDEKLLITNAQRRATDQALPRFHESTVELAHESLLHAWPRLTGWVEEAGQVVFIRNRLTHDASEWRRLCEDVAAPAGRADEELWTGTRLSDAQKLRARGDFDSVLGGLSPDESSFLDASQSHKERFDQKAADQLRREREAAEKNRQLLLDTYVDRGQQLLFRENLPYAAALWLNRAYKANSQNQALPYLLRSAMHKVDATRAVLSGEQKRVVMARYSPDGRRILTLSQYGTARVWDAESGQLLTEITDDGEGVVIARYSPNGKEIVTASCDRTVRAWDAETGQQLTTFEGDRFLLGHSHHIVSVRYSPDGRRILTACQEGTMRVWDAKSGRLLAEDGYLSGSAVSARYSPDGTRIVIARQDGTARVWDAQAGVLLAELSRHTGSVLGARYSPDGTRIVTASEDHTARAWDAESGRPLVGFTGHEGTVVTARYSPDGRRIVTASVDHTARVWDAESGELLAGLIGHKDAVVGARYSPNGERIVTASSDRTARVWDAESGQLLAEFTGHDDAVVSARYSPDGRRIVTASRDHTARVWDEEDRRLLAGLTDHRIEVRSARYSPDGRRIVTTVFGQTVRVWDAEAGRMLGEFTGHRSPILSARYSPDGRRIVTASYDSTARVWDAEDGELLAELRGHVSGVLSARYSPDGRNILTASEDQTARVWNAEDGRLLIKLTGHKDDIVSAAYSPNGRRILTASRDHTGRIWDAAGGQPLTELIAHEDAIVSATYSLDGKYVVTASADSTARIWDAESGRLLSNLAGHRKTVLSARYSPDGRRIVTASHDGTARVWDAESGRLLTELTGHSSAVLSARYSPDGRRIVTASQDQTARVWDAESGRLLTEFAGHRGSVLSARYSPNGLRIVTASHDGTARIWDTSPETRTPDQLAAIISRRSCLRFEPEDGNVLVPCIPPTIGA